MLSTLLHTAMLSSVELESGAVIDNSATPGPAPTGLFATCFYSAANQDNMVIATPATWTSKAAKYAAFPPHLGLNVKSAGAAVALKTFWSATLQDTLTTGSAAGLAWAALPANGYELVRTEGYCSAASAPSGVELLQYWSAARTDSFLVAKGGSHEKTALSSGYKLKFAEACFTTTPPPPPPATCRAGTDCGGTGLWTPWPSQPPNASWSNPWSGAQPYPQSKDLIGWEFKSGSNPGYGGGVHDHKAKSADTWYPSWSSDGDLYTPWTDGHVVDDATGKGTSSGSGGHPSNGYASTTGQARLVGDDPFGLNVTEVATFGASTYPYKGRYPCGTLVYKGTWFYGTYYLDNPNSTFPAGGGVGPNPGPNCGNWCIQGPVVDYRYSTDKGKTWKEPRPNATSPSDNLFAESAADNKRVKFGAPHWVDFGQDMVNSPDGKAYLVGHGASSPDSIQAWMLGDQVYMARVEPTVAAISDASAWEFYAGGHGATAKWAKGIANAKPLVDWTNHTGVVTMTYMAGIKKYVLSISTASVYPMMTHQFDSYFLESDSITGPWSMVTYMRYFGPEAYFLNQPSKFLAKQADTQAKTYDAFLMYSANFAFHSGSNPPNSAYHMNLQQARFPLSDAFAARLESRYKAEAQAKK